LMLNPYQESVHGKQMNGYGVEALSDDDKTPTGKLHYHLGDDWRFTCRRR